MKTFKVLLAALLLLTLCACGSDPAPSADQKEPESAVTTNPAQNDPVQSEPMESEPVQSEPAETTPVEPEPVEPEPAATPEPQNPTVPLEEVRERNFANCKYVLEEVSTFGAIDRLGFSSYMPVVRTVVDGMTIDYLYSYTGELKISEGCLKYDYFGDGRTAMYTTEKTRFVNVNTGEVYLESAEIAQIIQMNDRYYFAVFADHGKVYDLERACFIDGLTVTELTLSMVPRAIEDTVFEQIDYKTYRVYLGDGSVYGEIDNVSFTEIGYIRETNAGLEVYDSTCTLLTVVKDARMASDYASDIANTNSWKYYMSGEYKNYNVIDINGEPVIPGTYESVMVNGDYIVVTDNQSMAGMYLADGTQILENKYRDIYYRSELGAFRLTTGDGEKQVYVPGCGIWNLGDLSVSDQFIKDYSGNFMVVSTGEVLQLGKTKQLQEIAMVDCGQGLIETYGGTTVLEAGYSFVTATEEHLYVRQGDTWHVYRCELVTE